MLVTPIKTIIFDEAEPLVEFIIANLQKKFGKINEGDVVVVTSKIVALSENRVVSKSLKENFIKKESAQIIETPWATMTLSKQGWMVNAGADESNANDKIILFPKNPQKTAEKIRGELAKYFRLKNIGVIITDTKSVPLRVGTIGRAVGYAGFEALRSYIGKKDIFGRKTRSTQSNIADALAASAVLEMGEGSEQCPLALIQAAPIKFISTKKIEEGNLALSPKKDLYSYVFKYAEQASHAKPEKRRRSK